MARYEPRTVASGPPTASAASLRVPRRALGTSMRTSWPSKPLTARPARVAPSPATRARVARTASALSFCVGGIGTSGGRSCELQRVFCDEARAIDDEPERAVAEHSCAQQALAGADHLSERLHDDFLLADKLVDGEGEKAVS